jgi:long-chain acyl-CoA synthetase
MKTYTRLFDILDHQIEHYPLETCLSFKYNTGNWVNHSSHEVAAIAERFALAFLEMGMEPGDHIAIISPNRPEWNMCDMGVMMAGGINVPIYPTSSENDYRYIFNDANIQYVFISDRDLYHRVQKVLPDCPSVKKVYSFDEFDDCPCYKQFLEKANYALRGLLQKRKDAITPDQLATIIYTSGTTGFPKGVMLSHDNIISNIRGVKASLPLEKGQRCLSYLPLCHIFERTVTYYYFAIGVSIYYAENLEKIGENIKEIKPHFFSSVPRLLEKVYDKLIAAGNNLTGPKKKLYDWAIKLANEYQEDQGFDFRYWICDKLVYKKWRTALGGNLIGIVTGAAALQERLSRVFNAAGIMVREGYGQTETSPVISFNRFEKGGFKFGTVGIVIPEVEVKFAENGEIMVKGPNVMMGYYKKPDMTAEVLANGWLKTGDIGTLIDGKFIKITDRVKELFKTSGGKYVAPQVIENKMKESTYIEQILVVGENKNFVSALIVPSFIQLKEFCAANQVNETNPQSIIDHPKVKALFQKEIEQLNQSFGQVEQIKKFKLLSKEWTIDGGELTPTLKIKRKTLLEKFSEDIGNLYK